LEISQEQRDFHVFHRPATTGFLFDSTPKQNQPQNKNKTRRREEEKKKRRIAER
jgi:hypothetical protein